MIDLFGVEIPLWGLLAIGIILAIIAWKLIKFALTLLVIVVVVLIVLSFFDFLGVFENLINNII